MALIDTAKRDKGGEKLPTRYYSKKQEDAIAKKLGGQRVKNSGATAWQKGDVHLDKWLLEAKTKTASSKSMSIQKEWLEKNVKEALFQGKPYTALAFNFGPNEKNYYIIDEELFETLVEILDEENNE
jgi:hypothetical protein